MQQMLNFVKGSLLAVIVLAVVYSPFETNAETPEKVEISQGVVTAAAIVAVPAPIFDSISFVEEKPATSSIAIIPTIEITATPTVSAMPTKVASPTAQLIAKNIVTVTPIVKPTVVVVMPTAQPQVAVAVSSDIPHDEHFTKYAAVFNVNKETLVRIARCESGFRAEATNGPYLGMFQYLDSTWSATRTAMGENPDPALRANAEEAIKTTAWKIAHGGIGAWPVCGK